MHGKPENLTTPVKSAVIKAILFDRKPTTFKCLSRRATNGLQVVRLVRKRFADGKNNFASNLRTLATTLILLFSLVSAVGLKCHAQNAQPSEYQIKAAFLYNFAKFVEWPAQAFARPTSPIIIGVLGENVFGGDLEKTIHGKAINSHPLQFKKIDSVAEATNCQILFISPSEKNHLPDILEGLRSASVLTVSETDNFTAEGGMINFITEKVGNSRTIHFQINNEAAKKAGLTISSKLLSLAARDH